MRGSPPWMQILQLPQSAETPGVRVLTALSSETVVELVVSLVVVLGLIVLRRALLAFVRSRVEHPVTRYKWAKGSTYVAFLVGVLVLIQVWFSAIQSLGTFLGLLSAGLAIALKDLVANFAGWLFIVWRRPFDLGDRIQIGTFAGDVIDRRIFQFSLMEIGNWVAADQSTGRVIHVPNAKVFTESLANYTHGFPYLWNELPVTVTFESNWRKAKSAMEEVAREVTAEVIREAQLPPGRSDHRFLIHFKTFTPAVYTSVGESGVLLTLRYLTRPRERRGSAMALWERILDAFAANPDVTLAYPTQRINLDRERLASPVDGVAGPPADGSLD